MPAYRPLIGLTLFGMALCTLVLSGFMVWAKRSLTM